MTFRIFFSSVIVLSLGIFDRLLIQLFDINQPLINAIKLYSISSLVNLIPFGATGFRAIYLKRIYKLKYVNYALIWSLNAFTVFFSGGISGLVGLMLISMNNRNQWFNVMLLVFLLYIFLPAIFISFLYWYHRNKGKRLDFIDRLPLPRKVGILIQYV